MTFIDREALAVSVEALRATELLTPEAWLIGFFNDGRQRIELLTEACTGSDWPTALFNAHALKGDASHVGAGPLFEQATAMEEAAHAQDRAQAEAVMVALRECFESTVRELQLILRDGSGA